ncbi:MAG: dihydropteroate synthase [Bacteroidota bacterium]|nr:dihydropteroate synthase [Bacteroidota bacterium]
MEAKDTVFKSKKTLNLKGKILDLSVPAVMSIINITPDSFYPGSRAKRDIEILKHAEKALADGTDILDIGGYSSRPGAEEITEKEELNRVIHGISLITKEFPDAFISVDTFRSGVAKTAVEEGACIINDISGGHLDPKMFETVAALQVPYILMHMRGTPKTMTGLNNYDNLVIELLDFFHKSINKLISLGIRDILIDPGIGFAKNIDQNYEILKNLNYFSLINVPILIGISRKSLIFKKLNIKVEEALNGTTVLNTISLFNGAAILRVHDTKEAVEAVKLFKLTNC